MRLRLIAVLAFALALPAQTTITTITGTVGTIGTTDTLFVRPAPMAPQGYEYVDYTDETGQTTPILVRTPTTGTTKTIVNKCDGCQKTGPLMEWKAYPSTPIVYAPAAEPLDFSFRANSAEPYLRVNLNEDYTPKSIMVRVDSKDFKMKWSEFEQMVRWYHHKDRLVWETQDGKEIR